MFCNIFRPLNEYCMYVVFDEFCYNYNTVGRLAMIFLNEFNFK